MTSARELGKLLEGRGQRTPAGAPACPPRSGRSAPRCRRWSRAGTRVHTRRFRGSAALAAHLPSPADSSPTFRPLPAVSPNGLRGYPERMDDPSRSIVEPDKRGGKPCIRGLRIAVYDVLDDLASGMTAEEIVEDLPDLSVMDIRAGFAKAQRGPCRGQLDFNCATSPV